MFKESALALWEAGQWNHSTLQVDGLFGHANIRSYCIPQFEVAVHYLLSFLLLVPWDSFCHFYCICLKAGYPCHLFDSPWFDIGIMCTHTYVNPFLFSLIVVGPVFLWPWLGRKRQHTASGRKLLSMPYMVSSGQVLFYSSCVMPGRLLVYCDYTVNNKGYFDVHYVLT